MVEVVVEEAEAEAPPPPKRLRCRLRPLREPLQAGRTPALIRNIEAAGAPESRPCRRCTGRYVQRRFLAEGNVQTVCITSGSLGCGRTRSSEEYTARPSGVCGVRRILQSPGRLRGAFVAT